MHPPLRAGELYAEKRTEKKAHSDPAMTLTWQTMDIIYSDAHFAASSLCCALTKKILVSTILNSKN